MDVACVGYESVLRRLEQCQDLEKVLVARSDLPVLEAEVLDLVAGYCVEDSVGR